MGYFKKTNPDLFHFKYIYETVCNKINGVDMKEFMKLKMAQNAVSLNTG